MIDLMRHLETLEKECQKYFGDNKRYRVNKEDGINSPHLDES